MDHFRNLAERMGRMRWETSARTQEGRGRRVGEEVLERAEASHDRGAFSEAARMLEDAPNRDKDQRAQVLLGLARFAMDEYESGLDALDTARALATEDLAKIEINRANLLAATERFDEALAATGRARQLAPELWSAVLQEMAILLRRNRPDDRQRAIELARALVGRWKDWRERDIARYLALDVELAPLRLEGDLFKSLFGVAASDLVAEVTEIS